MQSAPNAIFEVSNLCFQGGTALHQARSNHAIMKLLLAKGADVHAKDNNVSDPIGRIADDIGKPLTAAWPSRVMSSNGWVETHHASVHTPQCLPNVFVWKLL